MEHKTNPRRVVGTLAGGLCLLSMPLAALADFKIVDGQNEFGINLWIDAQGEVVKASGTTAPATPPATRSRLNQNSSELRFTGTRKFDDGLQAFVTVGSEMRTINTTDATTSPSTVSNTFGFRNTGIGMRGSFGEVAIGRWDVHYQYYPGVAGVDSTYLTGPIAWASGSVLAFMSYSTDLIGGRYANTLRYNTPTFSGFTGYAAFTRNDGGVSAAVTGLPNQQDRGANLAVTYRAGDLSAFASYFNRSGFVLPLPYTAITSAVHQSSLRTGLKYTLPMGLALGFGVDQTTNRHNAPANGGEAQAKRTSWAVPVSYRVGKHDLSASYASAGNASGDLLVNSPLATNDDTGAKFLHLGYKYWLDKDTNFHVGWAKVTNQPNANYDLYLGGGIGLRGARALAGTDAQSVQVGLFTRF